MLKTFISIGFWVWKTLFFFLSIYKRLYILYNLFDFVDKIIAIFLIEKT